MSYVVSNLDELAELFEARAADAERSAALMTASHIEARLKGEAIGWKAAAYIARRTTLKEAA